MNLSIKYAGSICVYSMLQEIIIIQIRDIYLGRRKIEDYKISIRKKENIIKDEEKKEK